MKAQDLRLGNFVIAKNEIIKIIEFRESFVLGENDNNLIRCLPSQIKPIELTEEVLLKIGFHEGYNKIFIKNTKNDYVKYYITYQHVPDNKYSFVGYGYKNNVQIKCVILNDIKYLHQLQNACFLLTNQELEIEL